MTATRALSGSAATQPVTQPAAEPGAVAEPGTVAVPGDNPAIAQAGQAREPISATPGLPPRLVAILAGIVAPTTVLTALLYYFGWSHAYWFFNYFGVDSSLLGFTSTDYLMRSVDALFVPLTVAAAAALLVGWGQSVLRARLAAGTRQAARRVLLPAAAIAGGALAAGGFCSVFATTVLSEHLVAAPLSLGFGVLLLAYVVRLWRSGPAGEQERARGWTAAAEWAIVFVLVGLSLFWAATDYSAAVGRSRARDFVAHLATYPDVVVYSQASLSLAAPGVREAHCQDPRAEYRFRYDGLKLVLQSGDQYLFVPAAWTPARGVAMLIPRGSALRLEFYPASARPRPASPAC
jgi:hypothetical protein